MGFDLGTKSKNISDKINIRIWEPFLEATRLWSICLERIFHARLGASIYFQFWSVDIISDKIIRPRNQIKDKRFPRYRSFPRKSLFPLSNRPILLNGFLFHFLPIFYVVVGKNTWYQIRGFDLWTTYQIKWFPFNYKAAVYYMVLYYY